MKRDRRKTTQPDTTTAIAPTPSDPTGEVSLFENAGMPSLDDDAEKIFAYVESRARSVGSQIKKNRGLPPGASPENMLSLDEKAICILGRAIGVVWEEIDARIRALRTVRGEPLPTRDPWTLSNSTVESHPEIVAAIQADMVRGIEAFSPLVRGQQRFVWRARILELYRRQMFEAVDNLQRTRTYEGLDSEEYAEALELVRALDRSMGPHMNWFDKIAKGKDLSSLLDDPSDIMRRQQATEREAEIERMFLEGEIDELERAQMLRVVRFDDEQPER